MTLLDPIEGDRAADAGDYTQALTDYETPLGKYLVAKLGQDWWHSTTGQVIANQSLPPSALFTLNGGQTQRVYGQFPEAAHVPGQVTANDMPLDARQGIIARLRALPADQQPVVQAAIERQLTQMGVKFYTEEEWDNSPDHRAMPFEPFMTPQRAQAKAKVFDENRQRDWLIAHRPDGPISGTLGFLAGMAGGAADPINLIGGGIGGRLVLNLARSGGLNLLKAGGIGALDGAITSAVQGAAVKPSLAKWGEDLSWGDIAKSSVLSALFGGTLGLAGQGARMLRSPHEPVGGGSLRIGQIDDPRLPQNPNFDPASAAQASPKALFHYTDEKGLAAILDSGKLNPSLKALKPRDARYGDGQYLTDIAPGTLTPEELSRKLVLNGRQGHRFTHFIEIDPSQLKVVKGRDNVYVILNADALDLTNRIVRHGEHRWNTSK